MNFQKKGNPRFPFRNSMLVNSIVSVYQAGKTHRGRCFIGITVTRRIKNSPIGSNTSLAWNEQHEGKNRHRAASCVKSLNYQSGGHGSRTRNPVKGTSFPMRPLAIRLPSEQLPYYNLLLELSKMMFSRKFERAFSRKNRRRKLCE